MDFVLDGRGRKNIAALVGRSVRAVERVVDKILSDYSDNGKRVSGMTRLRADRASQLDRNRVPTIRDLDVLLKGADRGRSVQDLCDILNLPESLVVTLLNRHRPKFKRRSLF